MKLRYLFCDKESTTLLHPLARGNSSRSYRRRVSDSTIRHVLDRPRANPPCGGVGEADPDAYLLTTASHVFTRRAPIPRMLLASFRDLRLASGARACTQTAKRPGDLAFHDARSASVDSIGFMGAFCSPHFRRIVPLTPCRLPNRAPLLSLGIAMSSRQDRLIHPSVKMR